VDGEERPIGVDDVVSLAEQVAPGPPRQLPQQVGRRDRRAYPHVPPLTLLAHRHAHLPTLDESRQRLASAGARESLLQGRAALRPHILHRALAHGLPSGLLDTPEGPPGVEARQEPGSRLGQLHIHGPVLPVLLVQPQPGRVGDVV